MGDVISYVQANWDQLIVTVLAVLGAAALIARFTPTEADDKVIAALLKLVHGLAGTQK